MKTTLAQVKNGIEEALKSPGIDKAQPGLERYLVTTLQDLHDYIVKNPEPRGDLSAAQQVLAALWPFLNALEMGASNAESKGTYTKELIVQLKKEIAPAYNLAMANG